MIGISKRRQIFSRVPTRSPWDSVGVASDDIQSLIRLLMSSDSSTNRKPASFFDSLIRTISPRASSQSLEAGN
jgi:hypothetical protein